MSQPATASDPSAPPTLEYAGPSTPVKTSRRTGSMGLVLGLAWFPSEVVYSPTLQGRCLSFLMFIATVAVILILHRELTKFRNSQ